MEGTNKHGSADLGIACAVAGVQRVSLDGSGDGPEDEVAGGVFALQIWEGRRDREGKGSSRQIAARRAGLTLIVLAIGPMTVGLQVDAETCLNHAAQLALFLRKDVEIAVFGDTEKKWNFRGQRP